LHALSVLPREVLIVAGVVGPHCGEGRAQVAAVTGLLEGVGSPALLAVLIVARGVELRRREQAVRAAVSTSCPTPTRDPASGIVVAALREACGSCGRCRRRSPP